MDLSPAHWANLVLLEGEVDALDAERMAAGQKTWFNLYKKTDWAVTVVAKGKRGFHELRYIS